MIRLQGSHDGKTWENHPERNHYDYTFIRVVEVDDTDELLSIMDQHKILPPPREHVKDVYVTFTKHKFHPRRLIWRWLDPVAGPGYPPLALGEAVFIEGTKEAVGRYPDDVIRPLSAELDWVRRACVGGTGWADNPVSQTPAVGWRISKQFCFEAAHSIKSLPPDHKCSRCHGHSYRVVVELRGAALNPHGFVRDFGDLKPFRQMIEKEFDHRELPAEISTSEQLARFFYEWCKRVWPETVRVKVSETRQTWAEYGE